MRKQHVIGAFVYLLPAHTLTLTHIHFASSICYCHLKRKNIREWKILISPKKTDKSRNFLQKITKHISLDSFHHQNLPNETRLSTILAKLSPCKLCVITFSMDDFGCSCRCGFGDDRWHSFNYKFSSLFSLHTRKKHFWLDLFVLWKYNFSHFQ